MVGPAPVTPMFLLKPQADYMYQTDLMRNRPASAPLFPGLFGEDLEPKIELPKSTRSPKQQEPVYPPMPEREQTGGLESLGISPEIQKRYTDSVHSVKQQEMEQPSGLASLGISTEIMKRYQQHKETPVESGSNVFQKGLDVLGGTLEVPTYTILGSAGWLLGTGAFIQSHLQQRAGEAVGLFDKTTPQEKQEKALKKQEQFQTLGGLLSQGPVTESGKTSMIPLEMFSEAMNIAGEWFVPEMIDKEKHPATYHLLHLGSEGALMSIVGHVGTKGVVRGAKLTRGAKIVRNIEGKLKRYLEARKEKKAAKADNIAENLESYVQKNADTIMEMYSPERVELEKNKFDLRRQEIKDSDLSQSAKKKSLKELDKEWKDRNKQMLEETAKAKEAQRAAAEPTGVRDRVGEAAQRRQQQMAGTEGMSAFDVPRRPEPPGATASDLSQRGRGFGPGEVRRPSFEPEPRRTAEGQVDVQRMGGTPERQTGETIPRSQYQVGPDGKVQKVSEVGPRKVYKINEFGKPELVENIPGERQVWKIKPKESGGSAGGSTLYSGIPIDFDFVKKFFGKAIDKVPVDKIYRNKKLWKETGIWAARDGSWRYEIPFDKLSLRHKAVEALVFGSPVKLHILIKHKELFDAVPQLKDVTVKIDPMINSIGNYNHKTKTITIRHLPNKSNFVHEIQHAINEFFDTFKGSTDLYVFHNNVFTKLNAAIKDASQQGYSDVATVINHAYEKVEATDINAFVDSFSNIINEVKKSFQKEAEQINDLGVVEEYIHKISMLEDVNKLVEKTAEQSFDDYRKLPGEMESRLFQKRDAMTPEQRAKEAPWETLDKMLEGEGYSADAGTALYSGLDLSALFKAFKPKGLSRAVKNLSSKDLETIRTLARQASDAGQQLGEHLKAKGMPKERADQLQKIYNEVKVNNPHEAPSFNQVKHQGERYFELQPGEKNTNIGKDANSKVPIGERLYEAAKNLKVVKPSELTRAFTTAPNKFDLMGSPVLKELYYWWKDTNFNRMKEGQVVGKQIQDWAKTFKDKKLREEAGVLYHSLSDSGAKAMQLMGEKVNPNAQYKALIDILEPQFEALFNRINEARVAIGKNRISPIKDANGKNVYLPFFAQESFFARLNEYVRSDGGRVKDQANLVMDSAEYIAKRHDKQTVDSTYFNHLKRRMLEKGEKLVLDPLELYASYSQNALDHIYFSKINATIKELVSRDLVDPKTGKKFNFYEKNPDAAHFLAQWNNAIAGVNNMPVSKLVDGTARLMSRNLTAATLHFSPRTIAVQLTALLPTATKFGIAPTVKGTMDLLASTITGKDGPMSKSKELPVRVQDVFITEVAREFTGTRYQKVRRKIDEAGLWGIKKMDSLAAQITWQTAYNRVRGKMSEGNAIRYADEAVVNTQGSGARGDLSPIQTSAIGKAATLWQTYTINHANFIAREVLGIKNPELSPMESAVRVVRYVGLSGMITYIFADLLGLTSPQPAPIQEIKEGLQRGDSDAQIAWNVMLEMFQYLPVVSSMKFGSDPMGPVAQLGKEVFEFSGDVPKVFGAGTEKEAEKARIDALSVGGRLVGVPGSGSVAKYLRARRRGEPIHWAIIGRYSPDKKRGKRKSSLKYKPAY